MLENLNTERLANNQGRSTVRRIIINYGLLLIVVVFPAMAAAGQEKSWTQWSRKDAEKMLSDSPWAKTQVDTNTAEMFYNPTSQARNAPNSSTRLEEGATNQETSVVFKVRFFSARPIRQALMRLIELRQELDQQATQRLHDYAEIKPTDSIILTVTFDSTDKRSLAKITEAFNSASTAKLKNNTYLELRGGQRLFIEQYIAPGRDGFGARYIFPRNVDGQPFLTIESGEVRFFSEYAPNLKLNVRFSLSDMVHQGALEY